MWGLGFGWIELDPKKISSVQYFISKNIKLINTQTEPNRNIQIGFF